MIALAELGTQLRACGLTPRALAAWAGTDRIPRLAAASPRDPELAIVDELAAAEPVPAAIALALFVAGRDVAIDRAHARLPLDALLAHELVVEDGFRDPHEDRGRCVRATVAILPVGPSLVVCDRFDAPPTTERVCWPDDSSYHLAGAIPHGRVARWLDLGTGSAFAPLVRPDAAAAITGVELNAVAARMARAGAALSGIGHLAIEDGDLAIEQAPAPLVTCNAPMPGGASGLEMWQFADDDLFARLWRVLPERVAPGGLAVVHAALSAIPHERLAGDRRIVVYTPPDAPAAFGVLWWRPDAPERLAISQRALTPERPHVDAGDRGS